MAKIKTYRLDCTIMAGAELYHRNSLHVEGKMVPDMELEFKENPQYFIEHSYVEVPDPELVEVPVVEKEVEKKEEVVVGTPKKEKIKIPKPKKTVLKKKDLILKKKKKVVKEK